jgi:hypothetical protein
MSQAWLQVAGIIVEFIGVLLISWEWFTAQRQEQTERAIEAAHARQAENMALMQRTGQPNPAMQRHFEMTGAAQSRMTAARIEANRRSFGGLRTRAVAVALVFIVAGFALQLLAAWPGCCRAIGILPGG